MEFAERDRDRVLGTTIDLKTEVWKLPSPNKIPDLPEREGTNSLGINLALFDRKRSNREYYREFAQYVWVRDLFRPVRFVVTNEGPVAAKDVRVALNASIRNKVRFLDSSKIPDRPNRWIDNFAGLEIGGLRSVSHDPGDIEVKQDEEESTIEADCGMLQPGRKVWCEIFYLGIGSQGPVQLAGQVYASNLSKPLSFALTVHAEVMRRQMTVKKLCALADRSEEE